MEGALRSVERETENNFNVNLIIKHKVDTSDIRHSLNDSVKMHVTILEKALEKKKNCFL